MRGEGPPRPGGKGRGDILYRIEIEVPKDLSSEQQQALGEFAKTMNDRNPRERVLRDASALLGQGQELRDGKALHTRRGRD